jgi:pentose-5-phosphate-3-epimerase
VVDLLLVMTVSPGFGGQTPGTMVDRAQAMRLAATEELA